MIVLIRHDADPDAVRALADGIRELDLEAVPLDTGHGRAFEVVGADPSRVQELAGDPAVAEIMTRRTPLAGGEPVWPHVVLRVAIATILLLVLLALLTAIFPPGLGDQATAARPETAPAVEWYLRPLDQLLQVFPAGLGGWLVLLFWVALFLWPFLDRADPSTPRGRKAVLLMRIAGGVVLVLAVALALGVGS